MNDDLKTILTTIQNDVKDIKTTQAKHTEILDNHTKKLDEHSKLLINHSKLLNEHSDKLDSLLGDMIDVQAAAKATFDLVKATHENNRREIDEIKGHLDLPINPSPFK